MTGMNSIYSKLSTASAVGIVLATNAGAGIIPGQPLSHAEVTQAGKDAEVYFGRLMIEFLQEIILGGS
jgi:purine nucleoside phosphorylase